MTALRRSALPFNGGPDNTMQSHVRGGKGLSLAEMTALGLRVSPGFTLVSGVSRAFNQHGRLPRRILNQIEREIETLEKTTGRVLGGYVKPLLLSVRSGAQDSMPGMMDTLLNVGLTPLSLDGLETEVASQFASDVHSRLQAQWSTLIGGSIPDDPIMQVKKAVEAVLRSWKSRRAVAYRNQHGIPHDLGTAVTVQQMVFGNKDSRSCTGVVFSADPISGKDGQYGEFLVQAQGEDVVSGIAQTRPIVELSQWNEEVAAELKDVVQKLEAHFSHAVDIEFTVESGVLYVLQVRAVKFSPIARIVRAVRAVETARPRSTRHDVKRRMLEEIPQSLVEHVTTPTLNSDVRESTHPLTRGLAASPGVAVGTVTHDITTAEQLAARGVAVVLVRPDTSPNDLPGMLASKAIVTGAGGPTCHAAIVARDLGVPAVVNVPDVDTLHEGTTVTVDGANGLVFTGELERTTPVLSREVQLFQKWLQQQHKPRVNLEYTKEQMSSATLLADLYMTDLMAITARGTVLEAKATRLRSKMHMSIAERLATYLLLATAAESRHYWGMATYSTSCSNAATFVDTHLKAEEASRHASGRRVMQSHTMTLVEASVEQLPVLVEHFVTLFGQASWTDGYGGKRWAAIAECLLHYLTGQISPTVFSDQVFDLRHNGGRLFDKHPMIHEVHNIKQLLDLKKTDGTVASLKKSCDSRRAEMSSSVLELWQAGHKARLW